AFVDILTEYAEFSFGRSNIRQLHLIQNGRDVIAHSIGHSFFILSVSCINVQHWDTPCVLSILVQCHTVVSAWQALALRFDCEIVRNFFSHPLAPCVSQLWHEESVTVQFLAAVTVEPIATQESTILPIIAAIHVLWNEETAWTSCFLALRGAQMRNISARSFDREMVHQVSAKNTFGVSYSFW